MKPKAGVYRVSAVPVPGEETGLLEVSAHFDGGAAVTGTVADRDVRVGARTVKLSTCSRFRRDPRPAVVLRDGKTLDGMPAGLERVAFQVGSQTLTLDLSGVTALQVEVQRLPTGVDCTVIVRQGSQEVGRAQARLTVRDGPLVTPADLIGGTIRPPRLGADTVVKALPDTAADVRVGGGGRYLVLHLPKLKRLAVFDVNAGALTRFIPLTEDKIVYAAGLDKLVVGLSEKGVLERWNLETGEKELTRPVPGLEAIGCVLMGSASHGPVLVNATFFDLDTLKPLPIRLPFGAPAPWSPVSADGTVFGAWKSNQSPTETTTFVLEGEELKRYNEGGTGHVVPGPDGRVVYTAQGPRTNQLKGVSGGPAKSVYSLPAVEGDFYLALTPAEGGKGGTAAVYLLGNDLPLVKDVGFGHGIYFDGWDRQMFGPWKRIFLVPRARLIVVLPEGNNRLELHRFDLDAALEKSGLDYLLVTSRPPQAARRGAEFAYQVEVKSRRGEVKYALASGPEGMTVSPTGLVRWRVPAGFKGGESTVVLTIRDASGQEVFHTFPVRITGG
jgi:hypothetical protein